MGSATATPRAERGRRRGTRLTWRLLVFNLLLVFLPIAGLSFLGPYERQLLAAQERAMVQQGRVLSAALSSHGELSADGVRRLLAELGRRSEARLRVVDRSGALLGDSSLLGPRRPLGARAEASAAEKARRNPLYALGAWPFALWQRWFGEAGVDEATRAEYHGTAERLAGPEVAAALRGRYGAATRLSPDSPAAVILYSAIPVRVGGEVAGAVVVSQSTARILAALYEVRLTIFVVFLASVAVAIALSLFLAGTISRPIHGLAAEARALVDGRGRLRGRFRGSNRRDELGELARALEELTRRLEARQAATESFAADVSHELKNPLASIRGATEMLAEAGEAADRRRFLAVVEQEVARMEKLLGSVREIVHLDAPELPEERERVDLAALVGQLVESVCLRGGAAVEVRWTPPAERVVVVGAPERFAALVENLVDNAVSFSPAGSAVEIELTRERSEVRLAVADRGPGIPAEHLERVFDRFFSWRPGDAAGRHSGLGLAIVRAVAEAHGGRASAANRAGGGAVFRVSLPAA